MLYVFKNAAKHTHQRSRVVNGNYLGKKNVCMARSTSKYLEREGTLLFGGIGFIKKGDGEGNASRHI